MSAPYNPYAIRRMKEIAANGGGVHSVAREFSWTPDFVKRVRDAHGIDIADGDGMSEPQKAAKPEFVNLTLTLPDTLHARIAQEAAMLGRSPQRLAASVLACAYACADDPWLAAKSHALKDSSPVASASHPEQNNERK